MALPISFQSLGFKAAAQCRSRRFLPGLKRPGIMIGTEGETNTGKTEFIMSCPGPGLIIPVDRMYDAVLDNPEPPTSRREDFAFKELMLSMNTMAEDHKARWKEFYDTLISAIKNPDARTVGIDGDSDSWETQRLNAFDGKLQQVPPLLYVKVNAERRAMIARCFDSGKIIVATNKIKEQYVIQRDADGNPLLKDGKEVRIKSGNLIRQGFDDDNYLWHIQLRHLRQDARINKVTGKEIPLQFGIKILKCKSNPSLKDSELWGDDANFAGLVELAYPNVPKGEWGL